MAKAPWAADPLLQAAWALCPHPDYVDDCDPCLVRLWCLEDYLEQLRTDREARRG